MVKSSSFADRDNELANLSKLIRARNGVGPRVKILHAQPASGLTAFLRYSERHFSRDAVVLYVDCQNRIANSVFSQILSNMRSRYPDHARAMERYVAGRLDKGKDRDLTLAALECIPYLGPFVREVSEKISPTLEIGPYPSAVAELVCQFLVQLTQKASVTILMDNGQDIDDWSVDLLRTTCGDPYRGIRYVIGYVSRSYVTRERELRFTAKQKDIGYTVEISEFSPPDVRLVREICHQFGQKPDDGVIEALIEASQGDLYRLRAAIVRLARPDAKDEDPKADHHFAVKREIMALIGTAGQSLRKSDIITMCTGRKHLFMKSEEDLEESLHELIEEEFLCEMELPDGDVLLEPVRTSTASLSCLQISEAERLHVASTLYEHFRRARELSERHSAAETALLLYRLAKTVDPNGVSARARDLVFLSMRMGSLRAAERFIERAVSTEPSERQHLQDFLTEVSFLISVRRYRDALARIVAPPQAAWSRYRSIQILRAIALNRVRRHRESEALLANLTVTSPSAEETALLTSYRIVGHLHENEVRKAQELFYQYRGDVEHASNYGYFLRNGASALPPEDAIVTLSEAEAVFTSRGDAFGLASTRANRAGKLCEIGEMQSALDDAQTAFEMMEIFGVHHLHIALNNLGACKLSLNRIDEAEADLRRGVTLARTATPTLYLMTNLAAVRLLANDIEEALQWIHKARDMAERNPLDRAQQIFFPRAIVISLFAGVEPEMIEELLDRAQRHPDRMFPEQTQELTCWVKGVLNRRARFSRKAFLTIFRPIFLSYWYQNPLEALPKESLATKAVV